MVAQHYRWDFIGLSTDVKPTPATSEKVVNGSTFYCSDTSKLYVWCDSEWYEKTATGGGGGTSDFEDLTNRPKYNSVTMDGDTNIPEVINTDFVGTDGTSAGSKGLVPAPATTDAGKFLKADGTWDTAGGSSVTVVQTTGNSTTDVMSQDATTKMVYNGSAVQLGLANMASNPTFGSVAIGTFGQANGMYSIAISGCGTVTEALADASIAIGNGASITSSNHYSSIAVGNRATCQSANSIVIGQDAKTTSASAIAIGENAKAQMNGSVAIGRGSKTTRIGEVNIGTDNGTYGYNSTKNRILGGVYDGQDLHDAATVAQGNTLATSAPTTSTVGVLGQLYTDTTNMHTYQCTAISGDTYTWTQRW